jgi:hypothetical protein
MNDMFEPYKRQQVYLQPDEGFLYAAPQSIDALHLTEAPVIYFRSKAERGKTVVRVLLDGQSILEKHYAQLRPPEMERIVLPVSLLKLKADSVLNMQMNS